MATYHSEAVRRISNIRDLSYKCDGYDAFYRIEIQHRRDSCSRDYGIIELCDDYDKNTGELYIASDVSDHVIPELINKHSCSFSRDIYGGYLISCLDSSDIFLSRAIMKSLQLAEERSNDAMIYIGSDKVHHALIAPALRVCTEHNTSPEFIHQMSLKFKSLVQRANKLSPQSHCAVCTEAAGDDRIDESLRNITSTELDGSAEELVDVLESISCDEPIQIEQKGNEIILRSKTINTVGMNVITEIIGDSEEYYDHITVSPGKITTTNLDIIADLRAYLIKKTLRL